MRIIAGEFRGRKLPELKQSGVRPTLDRVRENLFNILSSKVKNCNFLDLFSGSGAIGFEAISRGANKVVFCEKSKGICAYIKSIGQMMNLTVNLINCDYTDALKRLNGEKFDVIYLDPPYEFDGNEVLNNLSKTDIFNEDTIIVYERLSEKKFSLDCDAFTIFDERKYGVATLTFMRKKDD